MEEKQNEDLGAMLYQRVRQVYNYVNGIIEFKQGEPGTTLQMLSALEEILNAKMGKLRIYMLLPTEIPIKKLGRDISMDTRQ